MKSTVTMAAWKGEHVHPTKEPEKKPTRVCCVIDDPAFDEFPSEFDEIADFNVLYEDKHCLLSADSLVIKMYYFPSGKNKRIPLPSISRIINCDKEELQVTSWGTVDCRIWWGYDHLRDRRNQQNTYFVLDCGDKLQKGFTCRRPQAFWQHLSRLAPHLTESQPPPPRRGSRHLSGGDLSSPRLSTDSLLIDFTSE